jgi:hypothetical protein
LRAFFVYPEKPRKQVLLHRFKGKLNSDAKQDILEALNSGAIQGKIFKWPPQD